MNPSVIRHHSDCPCETEKDQEANHLEVILPESMDGYLK